MSDIVREIRDPWMPGEDDIWRALADRAANEIERLREREAKLFTHEGVDTFWKVWNEIGEPHIHGVYESTWAAFRAALEADDE